MGVRWISHKLKEKVSAHVLPQHRCVALDRVALERVALDWVALDRVALDWVALERVAPTGKQQKVQFCKTKLGKKNCVS